MRPGLTTLWFWSVLAAICCLIIPKNTVSGEKLSDYLWSETNELQQAALDTYVVQGLKNGSLDPSDFGAYMVQDAIYTHSSKESIDVTIGKTTDPDLKQFLQEKAKSYESLYIDLFKQWHIDDPHGIKLGSACENYTNHLSNVAKTMEPAYLVVAMVPCVKLWPWIGTQIKADFNSFGVYTKWIRENFDPEYKGYQVYDLMVDDAYREGTIDKDIALSVYVASMKGEVDFFGLL
ncbi:uncharacterized protein LOC123530333 [Mercenaria mercenaria]|uniref:uncharacterized protein LOC123530333 n=1 Tax=Mercenaria mercenaria TaxID=6596 RepID=UPI00234EF690|nr:uncharacterized protein LOC123530333 [Mercenaria mercenaria]XP_053393356.1 uncharacterized protein LOC123530333 [Mercenaria mercenaria]